ncbi:hypothetical protein BGZ65_000235, partial [Modicella reniformis]
MIPTTGVGYQHQPPAPLITPTVGNGYTEEPTGYIETPGTTSYATYGSYAAAPYAYGNFNPTETFNDPTSQEAQAHLAYANQLREQQLYHQNMAEVLQKQQQQKVLKQQQLQQQQRQQQREDSRPPVSGSTVDFYPPPPRHSMSMPLPTNTTGPSSTNSVNATAGTSSRAGDHPYATGATQNLNTGMVTPGSNTGT